jgi:hypothetical protein
MLKYLTFMKEFTCIIRGEHSGYRGDKRYNAEVYLLGFVKHTPAFAKDVAWDLEQHLERYMKETNLPERTLIQAQRVLYNLTCNL